MPEAIALSRSNSTSHTIPGAQIGDRAERFPAPDDDVTLSGRLRKLGGIAGPARNRDTAPDRQLLPQAAAIFPSNKCESFGSAYLKTRSSDSFTAALKDFVPPVPVDLSNRGARS